ncbi:MAG: GntR family transcriptional regulator [Polymorphobacter sp.]
MAASVPDKPSRTPRYQQVADELRAGLLRGEFEPDAFPTEVALCARFGVSRFTIREALRALQAEGLIRRMRGSGTVIQPATARGGALHQPLSNVAEILQYAANTRFDFRLVGEARLPKTIAEQLGIVAGGRWSRFEGLRTAADSSEPIALTEAYVHEALRGVVDQIDPAQATIFRQIERLAKTRIVSVTQDIQAIGASAEVAAALGIARRAPCLRILRCYIDSDGRTLEISVSHHPGERFAYVMHIEVEG